VAVKPYWSDGDGLTLYHDSEILDDVGVARGYRMRVQCRRCGERKTFYTHAASVAGLDEIGRRWFGCRQVESKRQGAEQLPLLEAGRRAMDDDR
jgi:hypothetical protein